jgi:Rap1a immunity proteins
MDQMIARAWPAVIASIRKATTGRRCVVDASSTTLNDQAGLSPCYLLASYRSLFGAGVLMIKLTIAIGALAAMNTAAHSTTTVDQWIALCSKGVSPSCESYVLGVADAVVAIQATRPQQSTTCIPPSVTGKELVALVLPYVQGQPPAARQLLAAGLLMDVFREAFPCPRK